MLSARTAFAVMLLLLTVPREARGEADATSISRVALTDRVAGSAGVAFLTYVGCSVLLPWSPANGDERTRSLLLAGGCAALLPPLTSTLVLNVVATGEEDRWSIGAVYPLSTVVRLAFIGLGALTLDGISSSHPDLWAAGIAVESLIAGGITEAALLSGRAAPGARRNPFALWATVGAVTPLASARSPAVGPALALGAAWSFEDGRIFVGPQAQFSVPLTGGTAESIDTAALGGRFHLMTDSAQPSPFFGLSVGLGIGGRRCLGDVCNQGGGVLTGAEIGLRFPIEGRTAFILRVAGDALFDGGSTGENLLLPSLTAGVQL